jgi:hypothetical protein
MSWWFTSNAMTPVKVEGEHDRRYTVFSALTPPSPEYRAALASIHRPGGGYTREFEAELAAFAHALAEHAVDTALAQTPLRNAARDALINASRSSSELFLAEVAERGVEAVISDYYTSRHIEPVPKWDYGDEGVTVEAVYLAYRRFSEEAGMVPCKREKLGHDMRVAFPNVTKPRASDNGKRVKVYRGLPRSGRSD